jgi:membrane protein DedA with SNARE-associated domain
MDTILHVLTEYKYVLLFPLAIVEGPILAVIAGLLCSNGILNPIPVFSIIVLGDITGDSICYSFGRWGVPEFLKRMAIWSGLNFKNVNRTKLYFDSNPVRMVSLSKITLGIGVAGIYLAGSAKIPYKKFITICFFTSITQYLFYLGIGLWFGQAYIQINHYLDFVASIFIIAALILIFYFFLRSIINKI